MTDLLTKCCTRCGVRQPLAQFHRNSSAVDGLEPRCKACRREIRQALYVRNRDQILKASAEYYAGHAGAVGERTATWRAAHPEESSAYNREYYQKRRKAKQQGEQSD